MCSVLGCDSWRRSAQRFKLPEDPELRLDWVQFLATVNKQRFKESSWTDITICNEHFADDCFVNLAPTGTVQLTPSAVPSLRPQPESDEPEPNVQSPKCVEPVETPEVTSQCDQLTCDSPSSYSGESRLTSMADQGGPVTRGVSCSTDTSDTFQPVYGQVQPKKVNIDLVREKAALLKMKGKYVVNEKRLLQLFSCKCPSCGCKLQMEKVTRGVLIILNQQCLQCEYRYQWKSQVNASVPTAEDQHLMGDTDVISEAALTDDSGVPEIVAVIDEESDPMDASEESSDQGDMDSDEDWKPVRDLFTTRVLQKEPDEKTEDDEVEEYIDYPSLAPKHTQLCTECGRFFNKQRPHTCEHKIKPYSCNICGKRCVSEIALNSHSRIHNENYEHRCKYCHITFKTKVDKVTHEQIHLTQGKPYKCPDCSETFATNKERQIHLEDHRGPKQLKCHICGIEFLWPLSLQRHLAVHTGVKPFKCSVCQRGFNQAGHLKSHMRLHTGERPYKCQHCDKCFNHNVSLKSHVQRYHTSNSGCEQKKEKINERANDCSVAPGNESKRDADSELDNAEEEQDTEDEVQKERICRLKKKRKSTGRPIGRPKNYASSSLVLAIQLEGPRSNTKTRKLQTQKLKRTQCSDEESEDEPTDSDVTTPDSAEEEGEKSKNVIKNQRRPKDSDSDSDFHPEGRRKKKYSNQNSGKSSGKRRGRPRKNLVVAGGARLSPGMCSVVGCDSLRRSAQRFKLPEDPEKRLDWVQFLATVNKQRFKESSWTDITICNEHFTDDCFVNLASTGTVQLKPSAVPSLCAKSEPDQTVSEESDPLDETEESSDQGHMDSDEDWKPTKELILANKLQNESDEETEDDEIEEYIDYPSLTPKHTQLCTECVSEIALNSHSRVHDENYEHRCKYCHITFKTKVDKVTHEQIHLTQGKPYKCPDCSETFATNKERQIHLEDHRGPKQLKCHICGIEFNRTLSIRRHLVVHTGVKPFKCSVCQRGFNQAGHLKSHMRLHTGERPYKCQHCDKCFNHNVSLKSHVQRYHTSSSGCQRKRGKTNCDTVDAQNNESTRSADSGLYNAEEDHDEEERAEKERIDLPKKKKRSTGRPIGRPKRNAGEMQSPGSNTRTGKYKVQKLMRAHCSDEESEDEPTESDISFNSKEEEEVERTEKVTLSTRRSRGRPKNSDSDTGFDREDSKKKRHRPTILKTGGTALSPGMCSVVGCDSWRRSAQRFKLPEDPEKRLEWVEFLFEVNGQRLRESSWTDITVCNEHFTDDCFENMAPTGTVQLTPSAVPSLCVKSEPDEPLESPQSVEPVESTEVACQCDDLETCNPASYSEKAKYILTDAVPTGNGQNKQKVLNTDLNKEKAALLQMQGKYLVNESCLLQLFHRKCPSCGCKLKMEKVTCGVLIILNQQCLQCEYRNQWKSQVNACVPAAEEITSDTQKAMPTDDKPSSAVYSEVVTFSDEESDPSDEGEEGDEGGVSSDGEWNPAEDFLLAEELTKESEEETEDEGEEEEDFESPGGLKINELCTECGSFFNILKPHTCEHKIKPYSCNICGKRCVTETSLKTHSKIHDETYEHPCKYCHVTFKTRVDKLKHEQIHQDSKDPYKCPDCPESFATSKERSVHLSNHRTPKEFKCGVCGIEFKDVHHLRRHSVVHTGLKPYKCSVCQRGFNQTSHLKSHMRLHTGERPYKCQHCDKCFNHNVSLKSHVQRYHTSSSGSERKKGKINERASDTGDAEDDENKRGTDSEFDSAEEKQDKEKEVQKERTDLPKSRKRSTGRPRGRPKRNTAGTLSLSGQNEGRRSNTKTSKSKTQKLKKTGSSNEESEGEQSDSNISFDSEEEEVKEEDKQTARKSTGRSRRRPKNDSDSDFDPEEDTKRKRCSSQNSGKSSGKRRGRPRKNALV
ncbi:uncharacterized protein LOC121193070 [Toxotes jaculatrix]|uniref:uncharacterized protein LOC121193070 n=1 Tax=Toxotes jaculatrix TaxID=941984 RepID=UPI001B3B1593|nr:uncharacterized protein LOC121193070 [Toxotes jaculatrix]